MRIHTKYIFGYPDNNNKKKTLCKNLCQSFSLLILLYNVHIITFMYIIYVVCIHHPSNHKAI